VYRLCNIDTARRKTEQRQPHSCGLGTFDRLNLGFFAPKQRALSIAYTKQVLREAIHHE